MPPKSSAAGASGGKPKASGKQLEQLDKQETQLEKKRLEHEEFLAEHGKPVKDLLTDFTATLLLHKPDDVFVFAKAFFAPYQNSEARGSGVDGASNSR